MRNNSSEMILSFKKQTLRTISSNKRSKSKRLSSVLNIKIKLPVSQTINHLHAIGVDASKKKKDRKEKNQNKEDLINNEGKGLEELKEEDKK